MKKMRVTVSYPARGGFDLVSTSPLVEADTSGGYDLIIFVILYYNLLMNLCIFVETEWEVPSF
jgi:hypothetical protein